MSTHDKQIPVRYCASDVLQCKPMSFTKLADRFEFCEEKPGLWSMHSEVHNQPAIAVVISG